MDLRNDLASAIATATSTPKSEKIQTHRRIEEILREHDLKESDIPLNHEYWSLVNKYRGMKDGR